MPACTLKRQRDQTQHGLRYGIANAYVSARWLAAWSPCGSGFGWHWHTRFPEIPIDSRQPCKRLKSAMKYYLPGVVVTEDDHMVVSLAEALSQEYKRMQENDPDDWTTPSWRDA